VRSSITDCVRIASRRMRRRIQQLLGLVDRSLSNTAYFLPAVKTTLDRYVLTLDKLAVIHIVPPYGENKDDTHYAATDLISAQNRLGFQGFQPTLNPNVAPSGLTVEWFQTFHRGYH
jgi:hypothetical protein